ncbi:MAG: transporter [Bacteroidales bacterium]|nr:transporter [Bacteroidales bacterium]
MVTQKAKSTMMPIAMILGIICGYMIPDFIIAANKAIPYFIAIMLLITYSKLILKELKITRLSIIMLALQIAGSFLLYLALRKWNPPFAEQAFICVLCPVATAASVITAMLGGSVASLVSYTLLCYLATATIAPFMLSFIGGGVEGISFFASSWMIARQILPLILLPLLITIILRRFAPKVNNALQKNQSVSFYLWSITLFLVIGKSTTFVLNQPSNMISTEIGLAIISLVMCLFQFGIGHALGVHYKEAIVGTQGLGQKNIALAMWMSFTYLNPLISVGLAAYCIWQNIINSTQLYLKARKQQTTLL